jgi:hypothetical protein
MIICAVPPATTTTLIIETTTPVFGWFVPNHAQTQYLAVLVPDAVVSRNNRLPAGHDIGLFYRGRASLNAG